MMSLRPLAIVIAAAAMLAALPATSAQACDNDRYPCPIVAQPETPDTAARPAPRKKASRAAQQEEKARAKTERHASDAAARTKAAAPPQQAQAAESLSQEAADPAPALTLDNQVDRNENPVAAAAAGSVVRPATGSAGCSGERGAGGRPQRAQRARPRGGRSAVGAVVLVGFAADDTRRGARRGIRGASLLRVRPASSSRGRA
jgi:hypothetical protein